jgi:hypothetical protein
MALSIRNARFVTPATRRPPLCIPATRPSIRFWDRDPKPTCVDPLAFPTLDPGSRNAPPIPNPATMGPNQQIACHHCWLLADRVRHQAMIHLRSCLQVWYLQLRAAALEPVEKLLQIRRLQIHDAALQLVEPLRHQEPPPGPAGALQPVEAAVPSKIHLFHVRQLGSRGDKREKKRASRCSSCERSTGHEERGRRPAEDIPTNSFPASSILWSS